MDIFKQHKETEHKIHESLYNNLMLLSEFYPTTKEFNSVFRKDMFVKNNKVAFFEVIHYLLNILNPVLTKQKLTSWPIYDVKKEAKFRNELIMYLNELNLLYENADIPTCQASTLISPGGSRFAKFMMKISQVVLYEHLKKSNQLAPLYNLKPHKKLSVVNQAQLCHLEENTRLIECETNEVLQNFEKHYIEVSSNAEQITNRLTEANKCIEHSKKELNQTQQEFNLKYSSYPPLTNLEENLEILKKQVKKIVRLNELFNLSEKLLHQISGLNQTLVHNEDSFIIPSEITHIISNRKQLSLVEFFKGLTVLLERKALKLKSPTTSCMEKNMQKIFALSLNYQAILKQLEVGLDYLDNLLVELETKNDETALALPLPLE